MASNYPTDNNNKTIYNKWPGETSTKKPMRPITQRYFHNQQPQHNQHPNYYQENRDKSEQNAFEETPAFEKRKNELLNRIFPSRNQEQNPHKTQNEIDASPSTSSSLEDELIPRAGVIYFEDFIPFSSEKPEQRAVNPGIYEPSPKIERYCGSYSLADLQRVRTNMIEQLKLTPSHTNRALEILKVKIKVPGKFSNCQKTARNIKRNNNKCDTIDYQLKRIESKSFKFKQQHTEFVVDDDDSGDDEVEDDYCKIIDYVEGRKPQRDEKSESDDDIYVNADNSESFNKLYDNYAKKRTRSSDSDCCIIDDELDSKCKQFDKYKKNDKKKNKTTKTLNQIDLIREEICHLETQYRSVRDQRNGIAKKSSKTNKTNVFKREQLDDELKVIRRKLKKLRKNSRIFSRRQHNSNRKKKNKIKF